ncbi:hypothetical protein HFO58_10775 [Rhizobium leguminosarum]|uniref:hypothetical protein n=1 Tax=Rhizobium leguminosarum TaxID=384 RepID=UPI001C989DFD|nr:hypothetical protein [Rhizobium leguminosarum]MBY5533645.1 hypothetical protein [Rhizobium leguminosarum]
MTRSKLRTVKSWFAVLLIMALGSCQVMDSSISYAARPDGSRVRNCSSGFGSYSLPYSTIKVAVYQEYRNGIKTGRPRLQVSAPEAHPDKNPDHNFCLDFLENAFSDDDVTIAFYRSGDIDELKKDAPTAATGLLSFIASKNIDRTGEVLRNLLRAFLILASGDPALTVNRLGDAESEIVTMTDQDIDPFDLAAMADLNNSLKEYGFCLTMGKFTFDARRTSGEAYCNNPGLSLKPGGEPPFLIAAKDQRRLVEKLPTGIYYRPRQPYKINAYVRDDPDSGKTWELRLTKNIMLENLSPILALRVNRTIFAEYRTAFAFDRGNLIDACVGKGSEVLGGIQVPLDIIYGLVSLPAVTIKREIESKTSTATLLAKQREVIEVQNAILAAKAGEFPEADVTATGTVFGDNLKFTTPGNLAQSSSTVQSTQFGQHCKLINGS